jgi:hypothetical protein
MEGPQLAAQSKPRSWHEPDSTHICEMPTLPYIDVNAQLPNSAVDLLALKEDKVLKGVANGYAPLDASAKVPAANLPDAAALDAEVAAAVSAHNALTTVHGIANTADLATKTYVVTQGSNHNSSTSVHGIANTANLVLTSDARLNTATTSANGLMSSTDKSKLDGVASGAEVNVNADWTASSGDAQILNKPNSFTPTAHTHTMSDVTSLQATLTAFAIALG